MIKQENPPQSPEVIQLVFDLLTRLTQGPYESMLVLAQVMAVIHSLDADQIDGISVFDIVYGTDNRFFQVTTTITELTKDQVEALKNGPVTDAKQIN